MGQWINKEKGPTCFCGMPTCVIVSEDGNQVDLMCLFHTSLEGAMFPLPKDGRPDKWPDMTNEEMCALVDAGIEEQEEEENLEENE